MVSRVRAGLTKNVLNVKAVVSAFNQEMTLVGAFSVITNLRMDLFEALENTGLEKAAQKGSLSSPCEAMALHLRLFYFPHNPL